jgi:RimJ/RimL family protein N-acetyltransferase
VVAVLVGSVAALRSVRREDLSVLHAAFGTDPAVHAVAETTPWLPRTVEALQARYDKALTEDADPAVVDLVVQSATDHAGLCLGSATVWGIDLHNRTAHLGLSLVPAARGRGLGLDAVRLMCRYAFEVRDLRRVAVETLVTNEPMRRTALAAGFTQEGILRENAYVLGARVDEVVFGLLRHEWPQPPETPRY